LYSTLATHPDVYCCPIKEPNFFCDDFDPIAFDKTYEAKPDFNPQRYYRSRKYKLWSAFVRDAALYSQLFIEGYGKLARGEFSTTYLFSEVAAARIAESIPHAKIIICLRDPVDRAISHYRHHIRAGVTRESLGEILRRETSVPNKKFGSAHFYVERGQYLAQVRRFYKVFPTEQIKIILFDDLKADFGEVSRQICVFLGIDPGRIGKVKLSNEAAAPRFRRLNAWLMHSGAKAAARRLMPEHVIEFVKHYYHTHDKMKLPKPTGDDLRLLRDIYAKEMSTLATLINRDLSNWLCQ
jgi:hypothetical protein